MDVARYREQYAAELQQATDERISFRDQASAAGFEAPPGINVSLGVTVESALQTDVETALAVLRSEDLADALHVATLQTLSLSVAERPEIIERLIDVLRDSTETVALRKAVLGVLQESSFQSVLFAPYRPSYLDALRSIIDDEDKMLRRRAMAILAREKDEYVQRRLIEGLEHPASALIPASKAIQLLGYDVHAEHFPLLRRIVEHPPSQTARREAVRLLAADPAARDLLADLLRDKRENNDVRRISAIALQSLAPAEFEALARAIVLDDDEDDQLRATCLSALTLFANPTAYAADGAFTERVERVHAAAASQSLKQASSGFLSKYRP